MDVEDKKIIELITEAEVVKILRLDQAGLKNPREALRNLRRGGGLRFLKIGRRILYTQKMIDDFIKSCEQ